MRKSKVHEGIAVVEPAIPDESLPGSLSGAICTALDEALNDKSKFAHFIEIVRREAAGSVEIERRAFDIYFASKIDQLHDDFAELCINPFLNRLLMQCLISMGDQLQPPRRD